MYQIKAVSAMEKVFLTDPYGKYNAIQRVRGLRGERVAFQIIIGISGRDDLRHARTRGYYNLRSAFGKAVQVSRVGQVPVALPAYTDQSDEDYLSKKPGLYPDVLYPLKARALFHWDSYAPTVLMVTVDIPADQSAGTYPLFFTFISTKDEKYTLKVEVQVEPLTIAKNDLVFTQWFHCDSIASYFNVKMLSERHWRLIERFISTAARTGVTMLLTPIFTPPLDTEVGGERPTMQLVKIRKSGEKYTFDFALLKRWVDLCRKYGISHFEMAHLFSQWGVEFCPKIVVEINGKQVKEFGWHTEAMSEGYKNFLSQFLPALTEELKRLKIADKTYFHISDEPHEKHYENYLAAKKFVAPYLKDFKIMDALSNIEFYQNGLIRYPVCATNRIEPFMAADIEERWCYYCCSQGDLVSNRFLAMPSYRNRVLGVQLFMNDMYGFLQWGYNFYYSQHSRAKIDPFATTDGEMAWPAGDPFSVYPYQNGAIESIRTVVFYLGLQDRMLLKMLAGKIGVEEAKKWVEEQAGCKITFKDYPHSKEFIESLHDGIIDLLLK